MNYSIYYPTSLDEVINKDNDNIDVCVRMSNGKSYTIVFITPDNLKEQMVNNCEQFISPEFRFIVVRRIDRLNIEAAVQEIVSNPHYLNFYGDD